MNESSRTDMAGSRVAGLDPAHRAGAAAGRCLDRGAGRRRRAAGDPAAQLRGVRGAVVAGDPGPGDDPPGGRTGPARPRRLDAGGRRPGCRPGARLAGRADRPDVRVAAGAGRARARRRHRGPLRRRARRSGRPGWCWWTPSGWPGSSRRRVSGPRCTSSWASHRARRGTASSGSASWTWTGCAPRWASAGSRWRRTRSTGPAPPGQQAALGALMPSSGGGPADLTRIAVPTTMIWGATTCRCRCASPRRPAPASAGRCTSSRTPATTRPWNNPPRS